MALKAWVPAAGPVAELQREMNRLFDTVFGQHFGALGRLRAGESLLEPPSHGRGGCLFLSLLSDCGDDKRRWA